MSAKMSVKNMQYHKDGNPMSSENHINIRNMSNRMLPINFPPSKTVLWDSTPMGDPIGLHFSYYRNPRLLLSEKALRLSYRHAKTERKLFCGFLLGSFAVDDDEEGTTLTIYRFDPGREKSGVEGKVPSALIPGDIAIPCTVSLQEAAGGTAVHTPEDFTSAFKGLQSHLHSKEALDLSKLLTVRAHITYSENMDNLHFDLRWAAVTVANTFESTPIKPVPIIPTALARNLSIHNNIAQLQGTHKCGYLTMDQTRKLLLVLESDPKAYTLPLVGIWLSGITHIHSPQVWASALRYMYSSTIKERVLSESGSFLIVLYSLTHKEPEYYECLPCIGHDPLTFQLLTCEDSVHLYKNVECSKQSHLQFELSTETQNTEAYLFNEVSKSMSAAIFKPNVSPSKLSVSDHDSGVEDEDFSPRPSPHPHPSFQQVTKIHPCVPELSLVFGSIVDPRSGAQQKVPPFSSTPKNVSLVPSVPCPNNDPHGKEYSAKPSLLPYKSAKSQATKPSKVRPPAADKGSPHQNSKGPTRRNSACSSSSSSLSTPRTGSSPDTSVHQVRGTADLELSGDINGPCQEQPVVPSPAFSRQSPLLHSPTHNVTFPLPPRKLSEVPKQTASYAPCHPSKVCNCCHNIAPNQCHPASSWPLMSPYMNHCGVENPSDSPTYPNVSCPTVCCNAVCVNSCQNGSSRAGGCPSPLENMMSPGRRDSLLMNVCSPHSCQHGTPPAISAANGMLGLSTEAYRLLAEQDRQLKLLQAQIQRLLEAQSNSKEVASPQTTSSTQKVAASVATETEEAEHSRKNSVSIAVGTGASLYWSPPPCPEEEETMDKQDESDLCKELSAAVNNGHDASRSTIASSLQAVDICSFAESSQLTDAGDLSPAAPAPTRNGSCSPPPEYNDRLSGNVSLGTPGNPNSPALPPEKFYKDLLSQVNHLLKSSSSEEPGENESGAGESPAEKPNENISPRSCQNEQDHVLKATLKQLRSLGVNMEQQSSDVKPSKSDSSDNACVLASISPEAVIPRLNYMSFTNVGLSGFIPNGVDLSMEANAIALKYLSESQLTQLSLNHASKTRAPDSSSLHHLFPGNPEKSAAGLSVISINNMSFATKKYLKRYNLIESNDSSDDEADGSSESHCANDNRTDTNCRLSPDVSRSNASLEFTPQPNSNLRISDPAQNTEVNTLRNITNEVSRKEPFLKDLNPKLNSGKGPFTAYPEKENGRRPPLLTARESVKKGPSSSTGDILDVNRLRQLPKLF